MIKITETPLYGRKWDDFSLTATLRNTTAAINLTGCTLVFSMKVHENDTEYILERHTITITDPNNGIFNLELSNEMTANYSGDYWYDIELTNSAGKVNTYMYWKITFENKIS